MDFNSSKTDEYQPYETTYSRIQNHLKEKKTSRTYEGLHTYTNTYKGLHSDAAKTNNKGSFVNANTYQGVRSVKCLSENRSTERPRSVKNREETKKFNEPRSTLRNKDYGFESPQPVSHRSHSRTCRSPLSSDDDDNDDDDDDRENAKPNFQQDFMKPTKVVRSKKTTSRKQMPTTKKMKEILRLGSREFLQYTSSSLMEQHQALLNTEFGFGHGSIVQLPNHEDTLPNDQYAKWIEKLGFEPNYLGNSNLFQISSILGDKIRQECDLILEEKFRKEKPIPLYQKNPQKFKASISTVFEEDHHQDNEDHHHQDNALNEEEDSDYLLTPIKNHRRYSTQPGRVSILDIKELSPILSQDHFDYSSSQNISKNISQNISPNISNHYPVMEKKYVEGVEMGYLSDKSSFLYIPTATEMMEAKKMRNRARRLSRSSNIGTTLTTAQVILRQKVLEEKVPDLESLNITEENKDETTTSFLSLKVVTLFLMSGYFSFEQLRYVTHHVSKEWRKLSVSAFAWLVSDSNSSQQHANKKEFILDEFPWGMFLADGAYKEVFKTWCRSKQRFEAMSVMNITAIQENGNEIIVRQEVQNSLLFSYFVERQLCPNYVQVYKCFLLKQSPPKKHFWGDRENRCPLGPFEEYHQKIPVSINKESSELYQYIRMELCHGDLEDRIRQLDVLPLEDAVLPYLFQMAFGLYVGQVEHSLRHYDVKLLNFLLKKIEPLKTPKNTTTMTTATHVKIRYGWQGRSYVLSMPHEHAYWVKLGDFGTADTNPATRGNSVDVEHFTTLENTPIDQLLLGSDAVQDYSADIFALGLCMLHLFTGSEPYEVILKDVLCPSSLLVAIKSIWQKKSKKSPYYVVSKVIREDPDDILFHTLYRFLVLFGLPHYKDEGMDGNENNNKIVQIICRQLKEETQPTRGNRQTAWMQYRDDQLEYSLLHGTNFLISRARFRLESIEGAMDLLLSMVHFQVAHRPSIEYILGSSMFVKFLNLETTQVDQEYMTWY